MAPRPKRSQFDKRDMFEILYCRDQEEITEDEGDVFYDELNEQLSTIDPKTSFKNKCFVILLFIAFILFVLWIPK